MLAETHVEIVTSDDFEDCDDSDDDKPDCNSAGRLLRLELSAFSGTMATIMVKANPAGPHAF